MQSLAAVSVSSLHFAVASSYELPPTSGHERCLYRPPAMSAEDRALLCACVAHRTSRRSRIKGGGIPLLLPPLSIRSPSTTYKLISWLSCAML